MPYVPLILFYLFSNESTCVSDDPQGEEDPDDGGLQEDDEPPQHQVRSKKSADFLRNFYFNHFLNNFENLNNTIKRLSEQSEETKHEIYSQVSKPSFCEKVTKSDDDAEEGGMEGEEEREEKEANGVKKETKKGARVYTDSIQDLCESECQICGKRMTIKSLR